MGVGTSHEHLDSLDSPRPGLGGNHHLPPYSILCSSPPRLHPNGSFSRDSQVGVPKLSRNCPSWSLGCRNPTLAKCGGEAQHLEKVRIWSPPGLPNVQSSTTRPKTPRIEVFFVSLERSWSVNIENGLALVIWTSVAQVMGKRRAGSQTNSRPLKVGNRPLPDVQIESAIRRWKDLDKGYKFGSDLVAIRLRSRELWAPKVPGLHPRQFSGQFRDSDPRVPGKSDIRAWVPRSVTEYTIGSMVVAYSQGPGRGVSHGPKCPCLVRTPKGVPECELTTWVVCFDADSSLIY